MKVEYDGFIYEEFDTESTDAQILQKFLDLNMELDGDRLVYRWTDLTFEDLTITRTPKEKEILGKRYLAETDWYVARKSETDKAIPDDVLAKRVQARLDADTSE